MLFDGGSPTTFDLPHVFGFLRAACPDLPVQSAEINSSGQFNVVVMVDAGTAGEWIFRFPRYPQGVSALAAETRLLERLRGRLPLPIPDPVYARFDLPEPGQAFMGYRRLPGVPLSRSREAEIRDPAAYERMAHALAGFLAALHSLSPAELGLDLPLAEQLADWQAMADSVREKLYPAMRPTMRRSVEKLFAGYLGNRRLQRFLPCLRHGDFGGSNILFDPAGGEVTGVLDFSSCALGDPAMDLASLSTVNWPALKEPFLHVYLPSSPVRLAIMRRAAFYRRTFALMEALAGLENGDMQAYQSGMAAYI